MANHTVGSWDDLRNAAAELVRTINADERLALAAAANPMYAVEVEVHWPSGLSVTVYQMVRPSDPDVPPAGRTRHGPF